MRNIKFISYNGRYPSLCCGTVVLEVNKENINLKGRLVSGGKAYFDKNWNSYITKGPWSIHFYDDYFSLEEQEYITYLINKNIPYGCCGGCL